MRRDNDFYRRAGLQAIVEMLQMGAGSFTLSDAVVAVVSSGTKPQESWIKSLLKRLVAEKYLEKSQTAEGSPGYVSIRSAPPMGQDKDFDRMCLHPSKGAKDEDEEDHEPGNDAPLAGSAVSAGQASSGSGIVEEASSLSEEDLEDRALSESQRSMMMVVSKVMEMMDVMQVLKDSIIDLKGTIRSLLEEMQHQRADNKVLTGDVRTAHDLFMERIGKFESSTQDGFVAMTELFEKVNRNARDRLRRRRDERQMTLGEQPADGDPDAGR